MRLINTKLDAMKKLLFALLFSTSLLTAQNLVDINDLKQINNTFVTKEKKKYTGEYYKPYSDKLTLRSKGNIKDGKLDGLQQTFFRNGRPATQENFTAGVLDGHAISFYKSGKVKQEQFYANGVKNGIWKSFHENGNVSTISTYDNNLLSGDYIEYNLDGSLFKKIEYKDGIAQFSDELTQKTNQAIKLSKQKKWAEAITLYNEAIEINPTAADIYFNRGAAYANINQIDNAIQDFTTTLKYNPSKGISHFYRAQALLTKNGGKYESAVCEDLNNAMIQGFHSPQLIQQQLNCN